MPNGAALEFHDLFAMEDIETEISDGPDWNSRNFTRMRSSASRSAERNTLSAWRKRLRSSTVEQRPFSKRLRHLRSNPPEAKSQPANHRH